MADTSRRFVFGLLVFCLPQAPFGAWGAAAGPFTSSKACRRPLPRRPAKLCDAGVWPWAGSRPSDKTEALRSLGAPACIAHGHAVARVPLRGFCCDLDVATTRGK